MRFQGTPDSARTDKNSAYLYCSGGKCYLAPHQLLSQVPSFFSQSHPDEVRSLFPPTCDVKFPPQEMSGWPTLEIHMHWNLEVLLIPHIALRNQHIPLLFWNAILLHQA